MSMTCGYPDRDDPTRACREEDRRLSTRCIRCQAEVTISLGHHAAPINKDAYTCLRCRSRSER